MSPISPPPPLEPEFEGDYRPADPPHPNSLGRLADALNTMLDLETLLNRSAELVRAVIPYRIFAIFLLNDRTHELRMRFQIGHTPQVERTRVPVGKGVVGQVALTREPILLNDVTSADLPCPSSRKTASSGSWILKASSSISSVPSISMCSP